jgi:hypothetical protein
MHHPEIKPTAASITSTRTNTLAFDLRVARRGVWSPRRRTAKMPKELSLPKHYLYRSTKRTSKADRAARIANARAALDAVETSSGCLDGTGNKENMPNSLKDRISYLETALDASEQERERQMGLKRKLYDKHRYRENDAANKCQKLKDAKETIKHQEKTIHQYEKADTRHVEEIHTLKDQIHGLKDQKTGYQKQTRALKARVKRIPARIGTAIWWALCQTESSGSAYTGVPQTYRHKEGSIITDTTWDCLTDLMALNHIPVSRVASAFKRVAACLGVTVEDNVDRRSARRIQKEGGLAAKLQFVEVANKAEGTL